MSELDSKFPVLPAVRGDWAPIYFEVLQGSGERLTIGAVALEGQRYSVARAVDPIALACLYGSHAHRVEYFVDTILESLEEHLEAGNGLRGWEPPFADAVRVGRLSEGYGQSLDDIAVGGLHLTSSLFAVPRDAASDVLPDLARQDRWATAIRQDVVRVRPEWGERFGYTFRAKNGAAPIKIGYVGPRIAAHFLKLSNSSLSRKHKDGKSKLFDLESLRLFDGMAPRTSYELLISRPTVPSEQHTDRDIEDIHSIARDLENFADRHELRVRNVENSLAAASRLIQADA